MQYNGENGKKSEKALDETNFRFAGTINEETKAINSVWYKIVAAGGTAPSAPEKGQSALSSDAWITNETTGGWTSATAGATNWSVIQTFKSGATDGTTYGEGLGYTIYVRAVDKAGNVSDAGTVQFDVDMAYPTVTTKVVAAGGTETTLTDALTNTQTAAYTFKYSVTETHSPTTTLTVKKGGENGTTLVADTGYTTSTTDGWTTVTITSQENADYYYEVSVTDAAGKTTSAKRNVRYDTEAPVITVISPDLSDTAWQNDTTVTVKGSAADESGTQTVYYKLLDKGAEAPSTSSWTGWKSATGTSSWSFELSATDGLSNGAEKDLYIAAVDTKGNASTTAVK